MKHTLRIFLGLCLAAIVIVVACKKTNNTTAPTITTNVFSALQSTPQTISVTAGRDTIVYGASGTILHFYTNSFVDINKNIITSGTVNIQLVEMYKPGDMICNNASTTSNGQILTSGGQIYIVALMGTQEVYANKYGLSFKQSASSTQNMALFYGNNSTMDTGTQWTMADTSNHGTIPKDSTNTGNGTTAHGTSCNSINGSCYYFFDSCINFHWINADYILDTTHLPLTTVSVILPDNSYTVGYDAGNTEIFLVLPKTNSTILIRGNYNAATNTVSLFDDGSKVPIGWNYEIVVVANKNGNYYYWQTSGITTNGMTVTAAMAPDTQSDVISRLAGL